MNNNSFDSLRSPSPESFGGHSKRQKLDTSDATSRTDFEVLGRERELNCLKRENAVLRARLLQSEASSLQHYKIRKELEELFENEKNILEIQVQVDKVTIEQLREDAHEVREALAVAETKLSQMEITMEERITKLLIKNARLKYDTIKRPLTSSKHGKGEDNIEEEMSGEMRIEEELEESSEKESLREFNLQNIELKEVRVTIQKLNSGLFKAANNLMRQDNSPDLDDNEDDPCVNPSDERRSLSPDPSDNDDSSSEVENENTSSSEFCMSDSSSDDSLSSDNEEPVMSDEVSLTVTRGRASGSARSTSGL